MFKFKGISSTDMGVFITEHFPLPVSVAREEEEAIPGRDGVVTFSDGSYEGSEISGKVCVIPTTNLDAVVKWLQGWGELTIPGAEDRYYIAKVSNIVPISQFIRNEVYEIPITFKCQPFSYLLSGKPSVSFTSGKVTNLGNHIAKPTIKFNGGLCSITINGRSFSVTAPSGAEVVIDCEIEEAIDLTNKKYLPTKGEYPYFDEGENTVTCSSGLTIQYNWRML